MTKKFDPFQEAAKLLKSRARPSYSDLRPINNSLQRLASAEFRDLVQQLRSHAEKKPMRIIRRSAADSGWVRQSYICTEFRRFVRLPRTTTAEQLRALLLSWVHSFAVVNWPMSTLPSAELVADDNRLTLVVAGINGSEIKDGLSCAMIFHGPKPSLEELLANPRPRRK